MRGVLSGTTMMVPVSMASSTSVALFVCQFLIAGCTARPLCPLPSKGKNRQPLQTFRPYNIAHGGLNGELPEETSLAYMVHPYTFRNENQFLHFNFNQDPHEEYDYWINMIGVDGLFTDFTGSLHNFQ